MAGPWEKYGGNNGQVLTLPADPEKQAAEARAAAAAVREAARFNWEKDKHAAEAGNAPLPGDATKYGADYLATLPVNIRNRVQQLLDGRSMLTAREKGQPFGQMLMDAANKADPNFDENASKARYNARQQFTGMGKGSANIQAAERLASHVNDLYSASAELGGPDLGFTPLSNLVNVVQRQGQQAKVARYNTILPLIAGELQKLTKNGAATQAESEHIMSTLSVNQPESVRRAAIKEIVRLGAAQMQPAKDAWESAWNGTTPPPMPMDFSGKTHAIFDNIETDGKPLSDRDLAIVGATPANTGGPGAGGTPPPGGGSFPAIPGGPGGNAPPGTPPQTIASGKTRNEYSAKLSSQIDSMMNAGASIDQMNAVLQQSGFPPVDPASYAAARAWMVKNPGKSYIGSSINRDVPLSLLERAAGSPGGAFAANMANDLTAGSVAALAGDKGRGAIDAMNAVHPTASMAGSLVGGTVGAMGTELAAAKLLGGRLAARGGDALYGAIQGYNSAPEGGGVTGALEGAGIGLGGGYLGNKTGRYLGGAIKGVTDPAVQMLRDAGIPLTIGQALSRSGTAGRTVKGVEDAMTSIPGVGNVIDARRAEGLGAFNQGAFRIGGEPIGFVPTQTGSGGIGQLADARTSAYSSALDGRAIDANDPQFVQDMGATLHAAQSFPNVGGAQDAATSALQHRIGGAVDSNDMISGRNFQEGYRGLARTARERANSDYGHEVGQVMRQGQDALAGALERQNPGAFDQFVAANQANRRLAVLADAVNFAKNQGDELFTPAQLNLADANSATRLTSRIQAMSGDRPFAEFARAAQGILSSKLPDSGTAKRALVGGAITGMFGGGGALAGGDGDRATGAGYGSGLGLLTALALAGGGSKTVQNLATKAIIDRPDLLRRIGKSIQDSELGGTLGTGIGTSLLLPSMLGR